MHSPLAFTNSPGHILHHYCAARLLGYRYRSGAQPGVEEAENIMYVKRVELVCPVGKALAANDTHAVNSRPKTARAPG